MGLSQPVLGDVGLAGVTAKAAPLLTHQLLSPRQHNGWSFCTGFKNPLFVLSLW